MVFYVRRRFFEALVVKCFKNVLLPRAVQELDRLGTNTLNPTHTTPAAQQVTAALRRSPPPRYGAAAGMEQCSQQSVHQGAGRLGFACHTKGA